MCVCVCVCSSSSKHVRRSLLQLYTCVLLDVAYRRRRFPPKRRLLTMDEYHTQGEVETRKALDELRQYCQSPGCDAWKTVSRLQSPHRYVVIKRPHTHHVSKSFISHTNHRHQVIVYYVFGRGL